MTHVLVPVLILVMGAAILAEKLTKTECCKRSCKPEDCKCCNPDDFEF